VGFAKVTRDFTERMIARQKLLDSERRLRESEESLRRLSLRLLRTQDEERRRIARDLHESLGQVLSVLKMKLDGLVNSAAHCRADRRGGRTVGSSPNIVCMTIAHDHEIV
jgi:signal transduction histidine kinase